MDESADSYLISWFQELTSKENHKCQETLDKIVGGSTCDWLAAPRCLNTLTFSLQSNLCLIRNGEPTSTLRPSREPRGLQKPSEIIAKKYMVSFKKLR